MGVITASASGSTTRPDQPAAVVLHVRVVTETGGGPEKTILNSPRFLAGLGYRAACAYLHPPDDAGFEEIVRRANECQAPLCSIPDRGPFDVSVLRQLLQVCREQRVAIWHAHDYKSNLLGLLLRKRWRMRLVTTVHGWGVHGGRRCLYNWVDRKCLKYFDRVICVSDDLLQTCTESGVSRDRCQVISNGIDLVEYTRTLKISAAKRKLGFRPERLLVGAVGRLSAEKGFDLLIRAVGALIDSGIDVELAIVGDGEERESLERLIAGQSDPSRFRLLGYRSDVVEFYQALDVFALSSLREGLPNVLLEAMALETPVVATRIAGIPRLIQHDVTGRLVEPGDVNELRQHLAELLGDAALRASLAVAGRGTIEEHYSFAARMETIREIYDQLLGRGA